MIAWWWLLVAFYLGQFSAVLLVALFIGNPRDWVLEDREQMEALRDA